jgi:hypothetical protein
MGFRLVVTFTDSFMGDFSYVKDVEVCMYSMIYYIPGCICYGSRILDWDLCMMTILALLAQPHSFHKFENELNTLLHRKPLS